jgi:hypothetical protein
MFYGGGEAGKQSIGYATSHDKITWTKNTKNPVLDKGESGSWDDIFVNIPSVIIDTTNSIFRMWYSGSDEGYLAKIGYATAPDILDVPDDFATIQAAIDEATDGDLVLVDAGTYYENINFKGKAITVASHFYLDGDTSHISNTIIDGSQPDDYKKASVVTFDSNEDTNSVLSGFTITNGKGTVFHIPGYTPDRDGGGILFNLSGGKITHNNIIHNTITVTGDTVGIGAGITVWGDEQDHIIIKSNNIYNNHVKGENWAFGGGAVLATKGTILFEDNEIIGNISEGDRYGIAGGISIDGLDNNQGEVIVNKNLVVNNTTKADRIQATAGGGFWIRNCSPHIFNNIISGNEAEYGGGISVEDWERSTDAANPLLINNTVTGNKADYGGALEVYGTDASPVVFNTIFWDNTAVQDNQEISLQSSGKATVRYSNIMNGFEGEGNIDADPLFADTTFFRLTEGSPCISSAIAEIDIDGTVYNCPSECYFGTPRPNPEDTTPDMGACEHESGVNDIRNSELVSPASFELSQNYPNPFNPTTAIGYQLSAVSQVELSVYNLLGQKVVTLVSERQQAGSHQVEWDASAFASGVYYYRLEAGEFVEVKKMILLR